MSHPQTLNELACRPIQIYATNIKDLEVNAVNVEEDMDFIPSIKFLSHYTGRRLSQLEEHWQEMDVL